jgi:voltage-gated potassium channel
MNKLKEILNHYKFELFLSALCFNLFGSLVIREDLFASYLFPVSLLLNILAGINLISIKRIKIVFIILFILSTCTFGYSMFYSENIDTDYFRFAFYFLFYVVVTYEIIKQILKAKTVNKNVIMGVISGYTCLGLVGFFIFLYVEMTNPGSFAGDLMIGNTLDQNIDSLIYYSYITLMTIGYGEIIPATAIAQKAAILIGLLGQFYVVIVTALVVGKFISHKTTTN